MARKLGKKIFAIVGRNKGDRKVNELFDEVYELARPDMSQTEQMKHAGELLREKARDLFALLMSMVNLEQLVPGTRQYIMKKRGVFKTAVSRREEIRYTPEAIDEIEFIWSGLKPHLRA